MLDGRYSVICHLEDVRVGDVIDFAYTVAGVNPVFEGKFSSSFFTGFSRPVHLMSNILTTAPDRPVAIKNFNSTLQPNRKMHLDQSEILSWRQEDVPASSLEERTPGWYDTFGWVQISEYSSWKEVVDWGLATFSLDDPPEGELKAKIDEIAAKYASSEDRALAAIRFVQNDIRYLGIEMGANSYKPTPASQVCEHRFGDCKDKTQLCVVMLRALGINACPALVSTTRGAETENLLPSPLAFDHAIVKLTVDDRDYWIDVTRTGECGRLRDFYVNDFKQALLLRHGEDSLSTVSVSPESLPREEVREVFTIKSVQQPVELAIHRVFSGASAEMVRSLFNMSSHEEIEKGYLDMSAKIYGQIKVGTPLRFQDFPEQNRFEVWQDYMINRLWTRENSTMPWLATFYPDVIGDAIGNVPSSQRAAPYEINYPDDVSEDIEIDMFDKWTIDLTPISVSTPNFSCNFDPSIDGKVIHFKYHYSALAPDVLPVDIGTYADDVRKLRDRLARTLTYLPGMTPGRFRPNWIGFVVLGMTVLASAYGAVEIYRRRRARPRKPMPSGLQEFEGIRGWLVLIMIGNVIRIGWLARATFMDLVVILDLNRWNLVALPGSPRYSPFWAPGLLFEMISNVVLIALTVVAVILLAQSRALFPKIMIALLSLSLVSVVTEEIILLQIPSVSRLQLDANAKDTLQALVACAIWIPYLLISRRVKATCRG
jgi:transglutaminase-like putative cysteine protease